LRNFETLKKEGIAFATVRHGGSGWGATSDIYWAAIFARSIIHWNKVRIFPHLLRKSSMI